MAISKDKKQIAEMDQKLKTLEKIVREQQHAIHNLRKSAIATLSLMLSIAEEPELNRDNLARLMKESMKDAERVVEKNEFSKIVKGLGKTPPPPQAPKQD